MNLAVDSQQKNRIQVSNTKKPLFFYVNLTMRQDVWSLQLLESLSGSIVHVSSRCNAYVCRSALFPGNGNEGPILKSTAVIFTRFKLHLQPMKKKKLQKLRNNCSDGSFMCSAFDEEAK
ncbi:unnamed protein product [Arabidopsis halleri]